MRVLRRLRVFLGVLLFGALAGAAVFVGWLLLSTDGARWLLDWVPRAGIAELHVERVEGRLLGPLRIEGLRVQTPAVDIALDHAHLQWSPVALLHSGLQIAALELGELRVRVKDRVARADETPLRIPELPLALVFRRATIDRLELRLPQADAPQIVDDIVLEDFAWSGTQLVVKSLAANHALTGRLQAAAELELAPRSILLRALSVQSAGAAPARVSAAGTVNLDGAPASRVDLAWTDVRWPLLGEPQIGSRAGQLRLEGTPDALAAQGAFALGDTAQIELVGRRSAERIDAQLAWTQLAWPLTGVARIASATGAISVSGTPEAYRYALDAQLAAEGQQGVARASGTGGLEHVVLETLRLAVAKSEIDGRARIEWAPALVADADLRVKNLDPGLIAPAWPGRLNGAIQLRTVLRDQQPQVQFDLALKDSRLRNYLLALDARGEASGGTVLLHALNLRSGGTRVQARGQVTPPFDITATLDSPDLAALWPGLAGSAQLDARLRGVLDAPHVTAKGAVQKFGLDELAIERIALDADLDQAGVWKLEVDVQNLRGPAEVMAARVQIDGSASDHRVRLALDAQQADAQLEARGAYDPARRHWSGQIASATFAPTDLAAWTLEVPAALRVNAANQQLEPACWRALESRLCAQFTRDATSVRTALRMEQLDFAYFASFLPAGWDVQGGIDGTALAELRGSRLVAARADLSTDPISVARDGAVLLRAERGSLLIEETAGRTVATLRLPLHDGHINFDGELAAGAGAYSARPLSAQLDVALSDLGVLRLASDEIEQAAGKIDGSMRWTGSIAQPVAAGVLTLSEGSMRLATPGIELTDLRARLDSAAGGAMRLRASAASGGGHIELDGNANIAGATPTANLAVRGANFQAANTAEARAWISPRLDLKMEGRRIELSGEVDVPRADIQPVSFDGGVGPSADQRIVSGEETVPEPAGMQFAADVRLNLGEKVRFEGFGLKTELEGGVRVIEQPGRVASARGEVRLIGGRYKAYGQDLEIASGRLLFNGGPITEPAIEIRAQRQPREDVEVGVQVRGTLDRPEFQLYSTPAMPRERQLSWLVLGRSLDEEGGGASDDKAMIANAALSLGLSGTDFLAQNLRGGLKLDDVSIGATPGEDAQAARFTVGKYLSPKLYVSYGIGLFQPGQVFKLLYTLGHGFKFSTESGVNTGGDLLYSVER